MGPRQEHFRMLALYNQWANSRLYAAAERIAPNRLAENRGAFFGSLLGTLNHLLVTDRMWMSRLEGVSPRGTRLDEVLYNDFAELRAARLAQDWKLVDYVDGLSEERLAAPLSYATTSGAPQSQPLHHVLAHLFNHQTHHRGQAHHLVGLALGPRTTPVLDLFAYQRSIGAEAASGDAQHGVGSLREAGPPRPPTEDGSGRSHGTAIPARAVETGGELRADKEVPEPDSLGG